MNEKNIWFKLSQKNINRLYLYYSVLIFIGLIVSIIFIIDSVEHFIRISIFVAGLISSMGMALLGCSITYIRKLYKSCIKLDISIPEEPTDLIRQKGIIAYFILRPIFAIGFAVLLIATFRSGISIMTKDDMLSERFIYLSSFFAFFTGYGVGDLIDLFEDSSKKIVKKIFDNPNL